jgi:hypothetical protein
MPHEFWSRAKVPADALNTAYFGSHIQDAFLKHVNSSLTFSAGEAASRR